MMSPVAYAQRSLAGDSWHRDRASARMRRRNTSAWLICPAANSVLSGCLKHRASYIVGAIGGFGIITCH
jgi:hypothetical protein